MKIPGALWLILIVLIIWVVVGNRQSSSVGHDIKRGINDTAHDVKHLGRDVADSIRDTVQ